MSAPSNPGAEVYTQSFGSASLSALGIIPVLATYAPASSNIQGPSGPFKLGQIWINTSNGNIYQLGALSSSGGKVTATWTQSGAGTGILIELTPGAGTSPVFPVAGNISILGTANQITTTGTAGTVAISLPSAITAPGSLATTTTLTAGTGLTATTGAITAANGNLVLGTAGNKIVSTSVGTTSAAGANSFGSVALAAGAATVSTTAVTANSLIILWRQSIGATGSAALGLPTVGTITAGTSFSIGSLSETNATALVATDVSIIGWMIIN
jgi:hypothetical protein